MVPFSFANEEMRLVAGRALFWPRENALLVADLHLEKASFFAARGQMLPPMTAAKRWSGWRLRLKPLAHAACSALAIRFTMNPAARAWNRTPPECSMR